MSDGRQPIVLKALRREVNAIGERSLGRTVSYVRGVLYCRDAARAQKGRLKWFAAYIATALVLAVQAHSRPPVPPAQFKAVRAHWKHRADRIKAFDVMYCESRYSIWARNGQYLGLFQFGDWARSQYGFGWSVWAQTAAAFRYWQVAGWAPWECA